MRFQLSTFGLKVQKYDTEDIIKKYVNKSLVDIFKLGEKCDRIRRIYSNSILDYMEIGFTESVDHWDEETNSWAPFLVSDDNNILLVYLSYDRLNFNLICENGKLNLEASVIKFYK